MIYYTQKEGRKTRQTGKERKRMKNYIENTMEAMVEEALAAMEAAGEKLPEIRYNEEE